MDKSSGTNTDKHLNLCPNDTFLCIAQGRIIVSCIQGIDSFKHYQHGKYILHNSLKRQPYVEETTQESIHLNHMNIKKSSKFLEWGIQNQDIFSHSNITDFNFYSFFRWNFRVNFNTSLKFEGITAIYLILRT